MVNQKQITKKLPLRGKDITAAAVMLTVFTAVLSAAVILKEELIDKHTSAHYLKDVYMYLIAAGIFACSFAILFVYMLISYREGLQSKRILAVTGVSIALNFLFCATASYFSFYAVPLCFASIVISGLVDRRLGTAVNLICVMQMLAYALFMIGVSGDKLRLFPAFIIAACSVSFNIVSAGRINRNTGRAGFIGYLLLFSLIILPAAFLPALLYGESLKRFAVDVMYIAAGAGAQIFLVLFFMPLLERVFMITTNVRLAEICDLDQPLLKRLMTEAPATFNHSQTVGNLAESCASALNLNVYMARAAALYHDVGKLNNVEYFTENQQGGKNPHDDITPELSAEIIQKHTTDGYAMTTAARLPKDVTAITQEHHGTTVIRYFYDKAKRMTDGDVDDAFYRYKGDKPSSKIAAIIMICDSAEAAIRAMSAPNKEKVSELVGNIIYDRLSDGQFDDCEITMKDLAIIRQTIADLSTGLYHTRIEYPKN